MNEEILMKLEEEVKTLLDELSNAETGSDEYNGLLDTITKLYNTLDKERSSMLNEKKLDVEKSKIENEKALKSDQLEFEKDKNKVEAELDDRKIELEHLKVDNDYNVKTEQLSIDRLKNQNELINNREQRNFQSNENFEDRNIQKDTLNDSKLWNGVKTGVEIATLVAPLVFYGIWMSRGLKFEEEGSFTSATFKGLIGKFKPTK